MEPPPEEKEIPYHSDLGPNGEVPMREKLAYSIGYPVDGLAGGVVGSMTTPIFVLLMGVSPSIMSLVGVFYKIFDAFTDVTAGWLSDNIRTRWGRRRPPSPGRRRSRRCPWTARWAFAGRP